MKKSAQIIKGTTQNGEKYHALKIEETGGINALNLSPSRAAPFKNMAPDNLTDPDIMARIKLFTCPTEELGLHAAAMWESIARVIHEEDFISGGFDADTGAWLDSNGAIPIIPMCAVISSNIIASMRNAFGMQDDIVPESDVQSAQSQYWRAQRRGPIILVCSELELNFLDFNSDNVLSQFTNNSRIYIIVTCCINTEQKEHTLSSKLQHFVLDCDATVLPIIGDEDTLRGYLHAYFEDYVAEKGMSIAPSFHTDEVITQILHTEPEHPCNFIEKLLNRYRNRIGNVIQQDFCTLLGIQTEPGTEQQTAMTEDAFYGMKTVKAKINELVRCFEYAQTRKKLGLPALPEPRILMFSGPSGVGKSQWARITAKKLYDRHLIRDAKVQTISGAELMSSYMGDSANLVHRRFHDPTAGSVLFIDEIYGIVSDSRNWYAKEALAQLVLELERVATGENDNVQLVIMAGYAKSSSSGGQDTTSFAQANPGISNRISMWIDLQAATAEDATNIYLKIMENHGYSLADEEAEQIKDLLTSYFSTRVSDKSWGSGREARNLFSASCKMAATRLSQQGELSQLTAEELSVLTQEDVEAAIDEAKTMHATQNGKQTKFGYA